MGPDKPVDAEMVETVSPLLQRLRSGHRRPLLATRDSHAAGEETGPEQEAPVATQTAIALTMRPPALPAKRGLQEKAQTVSPLLQRLLGAQPRRMLEVDMPDVPQHLALAPRASRPQFDEAAVLHDGPVEDDYDPRSPQYVQPASAAEVADERLKLLHQQISSLRVALTVRQDLETTGAVLEHYRRVLRSLQDEEAELSRGDGVRRPEPVPLTSDAVCPTEEGAPPAPPTSQPTTCVVPCAGPCGNTTLAMTLRKRCGTWKLLEVAGPCRAHRAGKKARPVASIPRFSWAGDGTLQWW